MGEDEQDLRNAANRLCCVSLAVIAIACATAAAPAPVPVLTEGVWQVRIDLDSAPTRALPKQPVLGTIDFTKKRYSIDLRRSIGRSLPNAASIAAQSQPDRQAPTVYKITLGDSNSFDDKIILIGRPVSSDSIVGTWTETVLCCSAAGRFTLWRLSPSRPRGAR
jgi:hypothetical protein